MNAPSWITTTVTAEYVHGAVELETTERGLMPHRLNAAARRQVNGPVEPKVFSDPSGVRLRLRTRARQLRLTTWPVKVHIPGRPPGPAPVYDIWCDGRLHAQLEAAGGTLITQDRTTGRQLRREDAAPAEIAVPALPEGEKLVEIWLPYEEWTELIAFDTEEPVEPAPYPHSTVRWVHHGSSISHGAVAVGASHAWPAVAAREITAQYPAGQSSTTQHSTGQRPIDLMNLGFAGNAKLDPFTARTISRRPADVISLKLGINVVNGDSHSLRSFTPAVHGFLDTIRDRHAETPVLVVSPLWCGIHEHTPGPVECFDVEGTDGIRSVFRAAGSPDDVDRGRLTLQLVRAELERIVALRAADDPNLHFLSGLRLYGEQDSADYPLPDDLHPDTDAHRLIGRRFAEEVLRAGILPPAAA